MSERPFLTSLIALQTFGPNPEAPLNRFGIIAIDGGAATGKSTTARALADILGLMHVDTGSHYRALTWAALKAGLPPQSSGQLGDFLRGLHIGVRVEPGARAAVVTLGDYRPANKELRSSQVNAQVSEFAALPEVRETVKDYQRSLATVARERGFAGVVMEGRDIGTVIFPEADLKVFLLADADTRQARRAAEGQTDTIASRDKRDSTRITAPLVPAPDAVTINTGEYRVDEVVDQIVAHYRRIMDAQV